MLEIRGPLIDGRYRLLHCLRRGGMSEVFLAFDEQQQEQVALKLVSNNKPDCFKRLKREVRVLRKLSHEHILPILDYGEWEGYAYLVMPYMKHGNLRDRLVEGPLTQEVAGSILSQVASALQSAHEHGILHRDIKASNILLDSAQHDAVYLADFGLAKAPGEGSDITQTGCLIGTPEYMAPELVTMPESTSSDIYALGILLYQMLTGRLPFSGTTPLAICWKHVQETPPLPSSLNPTIAPEVEAVILRAIDKDPDRRFPNPRSMAEEYRQALQRVQQSSSLVASRTLPPVQVTLYKMAQRPTMPVARTRIDKRGPQRLRALPASHRGLLGLAALVWIATSISLGFIVGHGNYQAAAVASVSVHSIGKSLQPLTPTRVDPTNQPGSQARPEPSPTPAPTHAPVEHPRKPPARSPTPPAPHPTPHKHHKHGHGDGGGGGD